MYVRKLDLNNFHESYKTVPYQDRDLTGHSNDVASEHINTHSV